MTLTGFRLYARLRSRYTGSHVHVHSPHDAWCLQ